MQSLSMAKSCSSAVFMPIAFTTSVSFLCFLVQILLLPLIQTYCISWINSLFSFIMQQFSTLQMFGVLHVSSLLQRLSFLPPAAPAMVLLHLTAQKLAGLQRQQSWYKICCNILLGRGIRLLNVEFPSLGHLVQYNLYHFYCLVWPDLTCWS